MRLSKETLELADWVLMGPGNRNKSEYVLREALGRKRNFALAIIKETGKKLYKPAVKLKK